MGKIRSIILIGIFLIILIYLCTSTDISGQKEMIDIAYIPSKIFIKEYSFDDISDDSWNG